MKRVDALENEKARNNADLWNKVFLHRDGKFYHAYEWSAWLIKNYVCTEEFQKQRGDEKILAVNRYKSKNSDYVSLGFPVDSLSKYIPEYKEVVPQGNDLVVAIEFPVLEGFTKEELFSTVEKWKQEMIPVETKKSFNDITKGDSKVPALARSGVFGIISRVLSYPLEDSTPTENIAFISGLKKEIVKLL